jgi:Leucine-rich repeat (LRR) protein
VLDLRSKGLTEISSKLWRFDQITTLDLSQNQIVALPEEIISLKNLKTIRVQNSFLKKIPLTLLLMPSLVNIEFANNQLTSFYDELDVRRD